MDKILIGHCAVDSGQIMIADPCYIEPEFQTSSAKVLWDRMDNAPRVDDRYSPQINLNPYEMSYAGACEATIGYGHGELSKGRAVVSSTAYGDGVYPVYAELGPDGNVLSVSIVFEDESTSGGTADAFCVACGSTPEDPDADFCEACNEERIQEEEERYGERPHA